MKKVIILALLSILLVRLTLPQVDVMSMSSENFENLEKLTRKIKFQTGELRRLEAKRDPQYMRQTPGEFQFHRKKICDKIETTIQEIINLYKELGMNEVELAAKQADLKHGMCDWN